MSGDGVSMPTQLAQLGNVAKTQARAQQTAHATTNFSDQLDKKDELKAQRIKESQETEKQRVNPDEDHRQKRKKRRRAKRVLRNLEESEEQGAEGSETESTQPEEEIGILVDLRA